MRRRLAHLLALLSIAACASSFAEIELTVDLGRPDQSGFLQTPTGGAPATATAARPTVEELGLEQSTIPRVGVTWSGERWIARGRYGQFEANATTVVATPLVVQGRSFAAGAVVDTAMDFNEMEVVVARRWRANETDWWAGFRMAATDFSLRMNAPAAIVSAVDRAYHVVDLGIIGGMVWSVGERWATRMELAFSPQYDRFAGRTRADVHLVYRLNRVDVRVGVRAERFEYDDSYKQALPNQLELDRIGPEIGIAYRF